MVRTIGLLLGAALAVSAAGAQQAAVRAPRVVATVPSADAAGVPAGVRTLTAQFDQPMQPTGFSVTEVEGCAVPRPAGRPAFSPNGQRFTLAVRLAPDTLYCVSFNSARHRNFKNLQGVPAQPYLLRFATAK